MDTGRHPALAPRLGGRAWPGLDGWPRWLATERDLARHRPPAAVSAPV